MEIFQPIFQIAFTTVNILGIFRYFLDRISDVILISLPVVPLTLPVKFRRFLQKLSDVEVVILTVTLHRKYGNI